MQGSQETLSPIPNARRVLNGLPDIKPNLLMHTGQRLALKECSKSLRTYAAYENGMHNLLILIMIRTM